MKTCGIYKITNPSGKIYIGQSRNITRRKNHYKNKNCKGQNYLYHSLLKHGYENHNFEIVHELPNDISQDVLDNYEKLYWQFYVDLGFNMLNLRIPGRGKGVITQETRLKISMLAKERYKTIKNPMFGRKHSDEMKQFVSKLNKGRVKTKEEIEKHKKSLVKSLYQIDKTTDEILRIFDSCEQAAKYLGVNKHVISNCCRNQRPTAYGFKWKYTKK